MYDRFTIFPLFIHHIKSYNYIHILNIEIDPMLGTGTGIKTKTNIIANGNLK